MIKGITKSAREMKFEATLLPSGKTATGIQVPEDVLNSLGTSKKPAVRVTINGHSYRSTIAAMQEKYWIGVSAENREAAGIKAGDYLRVNVELDNEPREVTVPPDLKKALAADKDAQSFFERLSYSNKRRHVIAIEQAKTAETRRRRIEKAISMFREAKS